MNPLVDTVVPFFSRRSMAAASYGASIYFFGGVGAGGTESILDVSAELWRFDTDKLTWRQITPWDAESPSPRRCVGWITHNDQLLLWGGSGITVSPDGIRKHNFLNDFWQFDPVKETWSLLRPTDDHCCTPADGCHPFPFPRYTPVFQSVGDELFLFGGYTEDRLGKRKLNDVWIRSGSTWQQIPIGVNPGYVNGADWPGLRYGSMAASDEAHVYVCGGFSDDGDHNDLWCFDISVTPPRVARPTTHETGVKLQSGVRHRGRFVLGVANPYFSWTRGSTSTPYCRLGLSALEHAS